MILPAKLVCLYLIQSLRDDQDEALAASLRLDQEKALAKAQEQRRLEEEARRAQEEELRLQREAAAAIQRIEVRC
jgi:hypothetical protein